MSDFNINDYSTEIDLEGIIKNPEKIKDIKTNFFSKIIECINKFNKEITSKLNEIKSTPEKFKGFCESFKDDKNMLNLLGNHQEGSDGLIKYFTAYLKRDDVNAIMVEKYYKDEVSKEKFINKVKEYAQKMYNDNYQELINKIEEECIKVAKEEIGEPDLASQPGLAPQPGPAPEPDPDPQPGPAPDPDTDPEPEPVVSPSPSKLGKITAEVKQGGKKINEDSGYYTVNQTQEIIIELQSNITLVSPTYQINKTDNIQNISNNKITLNYGVILQYIVRNGEFTIYISAETHEPLEIKIKKPEQESFKIQVKEGESVIEKNSDNKYQLKDNNNVEIVASGLETDMEFKYKINGEKEVIISGGEGGIESTQRINISKTTISAIQHEEFNVEIKQIVQVAGEGEETKNDRTITIIKKSTEEPSPEPSPELSEKIELGAPPNLIYRQVGSGDKLHESVSEDSQVKDASDLLAVFVKKYKQDGKDYSDYYLIYTNNIYSIKDNKYCDGKIINKELEKPAESDSYNIIIDETVITTLFPESKIFISRMFFNKECGEMIKLVCGDEDVDECEIKFKFQSKKKNKVINASNIEMMVDFENYSYFLSPKGYLLYNTIS